MVAKITLTFKDQQKIKQLTFLVVVTTFGYLCASTKSDLGLFYQEQNPFFWNDDMPLLSLLFNFFQFSK